MYTGKEPKIDWFDVLKWVLIVLAAGFVGQFGKRLADHLIARSRRKRALRESGAIRAPDTPAPNAGATGLGEPEVSGAAGPADGRTSPPPSDKQATKVSKKTAKAETKRAKKSG